MAYMCSISKASPSATITISIFKVVMIHCPVVYSQIPNVKLKSENSDDLMVLKVFV